ncbi:MAG: alpha/beta hydrolase [Phototrophicales bacterium]|nr:MAG: alpha/beta hydrolase [Phototrophicales bacterium]
MSQFPVSEGITSRDVHANGIRLHILERGSKDAPNKLLLVHGNISAATWWEEVMLGLDEASFHAVAVDLRGYGDSEAAPVDATRGYGDFVDDLHAIVSDVLHWSHFHYVGHSMGGSVGYAYAIAYPTFIKSMTLIAPGSPYGFGGTKDAQGTPNYDDFAGSGGGMGNPELIRMMREGYRGADHPVAPLNALRNLIFKPPFIAPREDVLLSAILATALGDDNYPGNKVPSDNWPGFAPGDRGVLNALSPKYDHGYKIVDIPAEHKPPILWIRGDSDVIISNQSTSELGTLGQMGLIPDWPGTDVFPPQPMIDQIQAVLERYQASGGYFEEHIFENCGHSPHVERYDLFMPLFQEFVTSHQ